MESFRQIISLLESFEEKSPNEAGSASDTAGTQVDMSNPKAVNARLRKLYSDKRYITTGLAPDVVARAGEALAIGNHDEYAKQMAEMERLIKTYSAKHKEMMVLNPDRYRD